MRWLDNYLYSGGRGHSAVPQKKYQLYGRRLTDPVPSSGGMLLCRRRPYTTTTTTPPHGLHLARNHDVVLLTRRRLSSATPCCCYLATPNGTEAPTTAARSNNHVVGGGLVAAPDSSSLNSPYDMSAREGAAVPDCSQFTRHMAGTFCFFLVNLRRKSIVPLLTYSPTRTPLLPTRLPAARVVPRQTSQSCIAGTRRFE